jgi:hypothetical protein
MEKKSSLPAFFMCCAAAGFFANSFSAAAGIRDFLPLQLKTKWTYSVYHFWVPYENGIKTIEIYDTVTMNKVKMYILKSIDVGNAFPDSATSKTYFDTCIDSSDGLRYYSAQDTNQSLFPDFPSLIINTQHEFADSEVAKIHYSNDSVFRYYSSASACQPYAYCSGASVIAVQNIGLVYKSSSFGGPNTTQSSGTLLKLLKFNNDTIYLDEIVKTKVTQKIRQGNGLHSFSIIQGKDAVKVVSSRGGVENTRLQLFDIRGRNIPMQCRSVENTVLINVKNLISGRYFVKVEAVDGPKTNYQILGFAKN